MSRGLVLGQGGCKVCCAGAESDDRLNSRHMKGWLVGSEPVGHTDNPIAYTAV
jgi:hypothetical protein